MKGFQRGEVPLVGFGATPHRPNPKATAKKAWAMPPEGGKQAKQAAPNPLPHATTENQQKLETSVMVSNYLHQIPAKRLYAIAYSLFLSI